MLYGVTIVMVDSEIGK